jgi:cytochrome c5
MRALRILLCGVVFTACSKPAQQPATSSSASQGTSAAGSQQDQRLLAAARIALPPEGLTADRLPDPGSPGTQLLARYCTQCHALPSPAMHGAVDWPAVARRMWVRIDMMHGELGVRSPSEAERMQVLTYLTSHALQVTENLRPGAGMDAFRTVCTRCHMLPDPRAHSSADWPTVVMRMERNMERMRVPGVTHDQTQAIIGYLQTVSRR